MVLATAPNQPNRVFANHRLGIEGVTLHSYRYSWAERARKAHYQPV
jgi:hypothetical protein